MFYNREKSVSERPFRKHLIGHLKVTKSSLFRIKVEITIITILCADLRLQNITILFEKDDEANRI